MRIIRPPIKIQGIKTRLVGWIYEKSKAYEYERWVEPFMGSGVIGFNIRPRHALMCDHNEHVIRFYKELSYDNFDTNGLEDFLKKEGKRLRETSGDYYYEVRERFNIKHDIKDFLFLNKSCFNGIVRFNKKGEFNTPFSKNPNKFTKVYIRKTMKQISDIRNIILSGDFVFEVLDYEDTLKKCRKGDLVYCDPPYIGLSTLYYDTWSEHDEKKLNRILFSSEFDFILSTWSKKGNMSNQYIEKLWKSDITEIHELEHFYRVSGKVKGRIGVTEVLICSKK